MASSSKRPSSASGRSSVSGLKEPLSLEGAQASPVTLGVVVAFWSLLGAALLFVFNDVRALSDEVDDLKRLHEKVIGRLDLLDEKVTTIKERITERARIMTSSGSASEDAAPSVGEP